MYVDEKKQKVTLRAEITNFRVKVHTLCSSQMCRILLSKTLKTLRKKFSSS